MNRKAHNPVAVPAPEGGYAHGVEVVDARRQLYVSGQIPEGAGCELRSDFEGQCRQVWRNIVAVLDSATMTVDHLVKVTTYLPSREHADLNGSIRREVLGAARPALTVVIAGIYSPEWLLEIEAIAAC